MERKVCEICGKLINRNFNVHLSKEHNISSKEYYDRFLKKEEDGFCLNCHKETKFININEGYRKYCSKNCLYNSSSRIDKIKRTKIENDSYKKQGEKLTSFYKNKDEDFFEKRTEKMKSTKLEKYGDENFVNKEKALNTCEEKYGDKFYNNFEQTKKTNLERYGVEYSLQNESVRKKSIETKLEKYGDENYRNEEQTKKTNLERYGFENYAQSYEFFDNIRIYYKNITSNNLNEICKLNNLKMIEFNNEEMVLVCLKCNEEFTIKRHQFYLRNKNNKEICLHCNPLYQNSETSKEEKELIQIIKENYNDEIVENNRSILKLELDAYLPDMNLAFEFNGLYWHSSAHKKSHYHRHKTDLCEKQNIHLIHIYEDDWMFNRELVENKVLKILNVTPILYPNNYKILEISKDISNDFLQSNSLNYSKEFSKSFGLYSHNTLVYVLTMNKNVINNICEISKYKVKDGFKLIFNYLKDNLSYEEYSLILDRSWNKKEEFFEGFEFVKYLKEKRYYIINNKRVDKVEESEDNNYLTIYDSGSLKYVWTRDGGI